jgi:asparagine synthetase B (glutamine-hydrolysing)
MRLRIELLGDEERRGDHAPEASVFVLGDDSDWEPSVISLGNALMVHSDLPRQRLRIYTSIVGLPPVFLFEGRSRAVLASDVWSLRCWHDVDFALEPRAVHDVCRIGYPVDFRTLFAGISIVPGGSVVDVEPNGKITIGRVWNLPAVRPEPSWEAYTELQAGIFMKAVRRLDLRAAFLSLTAGLDTRTILAALLADGRTLPAYTMSWSDRSLDARTARDLCRAYGIPHGIVQFDESFAWEFPERVLAASRLSGGLSATEQATEVAFYERIGPGWRARVSGHLGNQVGRDGREQVSPRGGDLTMLGEAMSPSGDDECCRAVHHLETGGSLGGRSAVDNEVLFASVGNYAIGHHFVVQRSPYASRELIEAAARAPAETHMTPARSQFQTRVHDLRHRFLGEPIRRSFQRRIIGQIGGYAATCPINWGWRAEGGLSLRGACAGVLAFADALTTSRGLETGLLGRTLEALRIPARHDFRRLRKWYSEAFLRDTLCRQEVREAGLLDMPVIERMLDDQFRRGRDHHVSLMLALDLTSAHLVFIQPRAR